MTRKSVPYKGEKYHYYYCPTTKKRGCEGAVMLKADELHKYVTECVKAQVANIASVDSILAGSDGRKAAETMAKQYLAQIAENKRQIEQLAGFKNTLYENMIQGVITKDDYRTLKAKYSADETRLRDAIGILQQHHDDVFSRERRPPTLDGAFQAVRGLDGTGSAYGYQSHSKHPRTRQV